MINQVNGKVLKKSRLVYYLQKSYMNNMIKFVITGKILKLGGLVPCQSNIAINPKHSKLQFYTPIYLFCF